MPPKKKKTVEGSVSVAECDSDAALLEISHERGGHDCGDADDDDAVRADDDGVVAHQPARCGCCGPAATPSRAVLTTTTTAAALLATIKRGIQLKMIVVQGDDKSVTDDSLVSCFTDSGDAESLSAHVQNYAQNQQQEMWEFTSKVVDTLSHQAAHIAEQDGQYMRLWLGSAYARAVSGAKASGWRGYGSTDDAGLLESRFTLHVPPATGHVRLLDILGNCALRDSTTGGTQFHIAGAQNQVRPGSLTALMH
jgi:hypothetical protein